jgi:DNA adenine methylase
MSKRLTLNTLMTSPLLDKPMKIQMNSLYGKLGNHKSFLKWAGGKMQLLGKLRELGVESGNTYIEPFVGSGVIALNMPHERIMIGDTNPAVIAMWSQLKWNKNAAKDLGHYFDPLLNHEYTYYKYRDIFNYTLKHWNEARLAQLFLYLNKHCFNGLCRFNAKGEFNVPYGKRKVAPSYPKDEILHAIEVAKRMSVHHNDFKATMDVAGKGDMVYCDPPYCPINETSSFTNYSKEGFGMGQHEDLLVCAMQAQERGATVIISNNDTPYTRALYEDASEIHFIDVAKKISCKANGRKKLQEIIAVYRPK